jgi:hypothetical protein
MEMKDIPLSIIIFMPIAILVLECSVYGLKVWWEWFIGNNEE